MIYSTGTLASEGGGKGRGTMDERIWRRGALAWTEAATVLRFEIERWELSSGKQASPAILIA